MEVNLQRVTGILLWRHIMSYLWPAGHLDVFLPEKTIHWSFLIAYTGMWPSFKTFQDSGTVVTVVRIPKLNNIDYTEKFINVTVHSHPRLAHIWY